MAWSRNRRIEYHIRAIRIVLESISLDSDYDDMVSIKTNINHIRNTLDKLEEIANG